MEGLALGVDMSMRYALNADRVAANARSLPPDIDGAIVEPAVQGVIYKVFTRYTVREIFSSRRAEIQPAIETKIKPQLAADGITIGKITLPEEYQTGMEKLLAEELETGKMRYTLELKEKQVKQTALEADADKIPREKAAEAAGNEQIIGALAQEQAMAHVLPFKQKQIEQRRLEAEAEKAARIKTSEGNAEARLIEVTGEADARRTSPRRQATVVLSVLRCSVAPRDDNNHVAHCHCRHISDRHAGPGCAARPRRVRVGENRRN